MAWETILAMWYFSSVNAYSIEGLISEVEKKELYIKDLQNQKMDLETSTAWQLISLKTKFDALVEQERAQHSK